VAFATRPQSILGLARVVLEAVKTYFRSGHVSMTPALAPSDFRRLSQNFQFPLNAGKHRIVKTFNGSVALAHVARTLQLSSDDVVVLPAYCCGAELGPFLHQGCRCEFYDIHDDLSVNTEQLETLLQTQSGIKAVMITHYFGFAEKNLQQVLELCAKYRVALIEDCAHALFSTDGTHPLGTVGQYSIFSPRKSVPLTEGGVMVWNQPGSNTDNLTAPALLPTWQRLGYSLQQNFRSQSRDTTPGQQGLRVLLMTLVLAPAIGIKLIKKLPMFKRSQWLTADAEGEQAIPLYFVGMSKFSAGLLSRANSEQIVQARRRHYLEWLDEVKRLRTSTAGQSAAAGIRPLLDYLPSGCCPLYFPVLVESPAKVTKFLAQHDIEAFNWWQYKHEAVDWSEFPMASKLKRSVVALPVHQKLPAGSVQRMAECLQQSLGSE